MVVLFLPFAALLTLGVLIKRKPGLKKKLLQVYKYKATRLSLLAAAFFAFLAGWHLLIFFHLLSDSNPFILSRLLPVTLWLLSGGLILLVGLPGMSEDHVSRKSAMKTGILFLISLLFFAIFWVLAARFGLGSTAESTTVSDLGVPLMEWQIIYTCGLLAAAWLACNAAAALGLFKKNLSTKEQRWLDLALFLVIWLLAVLIWLRQPIPQNNYFAPQQLPPNYETYPFSDAQRYSLDALQFLFGDTRAEIVSKPMFILFLAALHGLGGVDYERVVFFQTLILALFPAVLYLIGKKLGSRMLGLSASLLAIFREVNFIQASDIANVSNSKLLMTDFPYTLGISLLAFATIGWLQKKKERSLSLILIGGLLAINCLLRPQTLILVPFYALLALIRNWKDWKRVITAFGVIAMILLLTISPLLVRNYVVGQYFWFDAPSYMSKFASSYALSNITEDEDFSEAASPAADAAQPAGSMLALFSAGNSKLMTGIANNFFRNLLSAFLQFPVRALPSIPLQEYKAIQENFWAHMGVYDHPLNYLLALLNCVLFALGIERLWRHDSRVLAALLGLFACISLSTALFRFSGWRFIMPVDWIFYFLYLRGFLGILEWIAGSADPKSAAAGGNPARLRCGVSEALTLALFVLAGALIPLREAFIQTPVKPEKAELCAQLADLRDADSSEISEDALLELCLSPESVVSSGILLYPRYFQSGFGYVQRPNPYYGTLDYGRMSFYVLDGVTSRYVFPSENPQQLEAYRNGRTIILLSRPELLPQVQVIAVAGRAGSLRVSSHFDAK